MKIIILFLIFISLVIYGGIKTDWFTIFCGDQVQDGFTWIVWLFISVVGIAILGWNWLMKKEREEQI